MTPDELSNMTPGKMARNLVPGYGNLMTTDEIRDNPKAYMMIGDLDKPFHFPECECDECEAWRIKMGRLTHEQLRNEMRKGNQ